MNTDEKTNYPNLLKSTFQQKFNQEPLIFSSPGRVNLIGEHTDYNMGFVLPAAINKNIFLAIQKTESQEIQLISYDYQESYSTTLDSIKPSGKLWPDYILGVVDQMQKRGAHFTGFNIIFGGNIPEGAGLSSSAALECASAFAFNHLFDLGFSKIELAKLSQSAENEFVGVKCGIMDQFASVFGKEENLIRLDCESLEFTYIPFRASNIKLVLFDTRVKHSLATSAYNKRREECEKAVSLINAHHPEISSLRYATEEMLLKFVKPFDEIAYQRSTYVVAEIKRLIDGCVELENDEIEKFGKRMFETHLGLKNLYGVSCDELDHLVDLVKGNPNVLGARMMGGGFGGCTINLIKTEAIESTIKEVSEGYKKLTGKDVETYIAEIGKGTCLLN